MERLRVPVLPFETTLVYSETIIREAVWHFWRRAVGWRFVPVRLILATLPGFVFWRGDRSWRRGLLRAAFLPGAGMAVAIFAPPYLNSMAKRRQMGSPSAVFVATEEALSMTSGAGSTTLPWSSVAEVWRFPGLWRLLFSKAQFVTLPLACAPDDLQACIAERVTHAGGKLV